MYKSHKLLCACCLALLSACGGGDNAVPVVEKPPSFSIPQFFVPTFTRLSLAWGAISMADFNGDLVDDLLGSISSTSGPVALSEADLGLGDLRLPGRAYRDIRFADFNNDGFLDAIANVYTEDPTQGYVQLYWGDGAGKFIIDTNFSLNNYQGFGETIVVADFNNDNYLDIFIPQYKTATREISRNLLLKNIKNKQFEEVAVAAGVAMGAAKPEGAQAVDYDQDGLIDLYAAGSLFKNNGNLNFSDVTALVGLPGVFDEGAKFFDQNNDGILDLIIHHPLYGPRIFLGGLNGKFTELTGVFPSEFFKASYGINVGDVNGDSFDDILIAGGLAQDGSNAAPRLWLYKDGKYQSENFIEPDLGWSDLVSFGDLDNNGSLDIVLRYGGNMIFFNEQVPEKFIKIDIRGGGLKNQQGRVAKAYLPNGKIKAMVVDGGSGFMSNQPYQLLIPNNFDAPINFNIHCGNKVISLNMLNGYRTVDCGLL